MPETSVARGRAGGGETPKKGFYSDFSKIYPQAGSLLKEIVFRSFLKTFLGKMRIATAQSYQGLWRGCFFERYHFGGERYHFGGERYHFGG